MNLDTTGKKGFIEFDEIDDFDFDDSIPEPGVVATAAAGLKEELMDPAFIRRAMKAVLPKGFAEAFDHIRDTYDAAKSIYSDSSDEIDALKKSAGELAGAIAEAGEGYIPGVIKSKLDDFYQAHGVTHYEESIEDRLKEKTKRLFDDLKSDTTDAVHHEEDRADMAVSNQLAGISGKLLGNLVNLQADASKFRTSFTETYYRKSIELLYRQTHYQQKLYEITGKMHGEVRRIVHNTGLSDFAKERFARDADNREDRRETGLLENAMFGEHGFHGFRNTLGEKFRNNITRLLKDKLGDVEGGLGMLAGALDMAGGDNKQITKEFLYGKAAMGGLGFLGNKIKDYLTENHDRFMAEAPEGLYAKAHGFLTSDELKRKGALAHYVAADTAGESKRLLKQLSELSPELVYDEEGNAKIKRHWMSTLASGLADTGDDLEVRRSFGTEDLSQPVPFTGLVHRSLVEVIPGLLSRLLQSSEGIRTGKMTTSGARTAYDFEKGKFSTEADIRQRYIEEELIPKQKRISDLAKKLIDQIAGDQELSSGARTVMSRILEKQLASGSDHPDFYRLVNDDEYGTGEEEARDEIVELLNRRMGIVATDPFAPKATTPNQIFRQYQREMNALTKEQLELRTGTLGTYKEGAPNVAGELRRRMLMESAGGSGWMREAGLITEEGRISTENIHAQDVEEVVDNGIVSKAKRGARKLRNRLTGNDTTPLPVAEASISGGAVIELSRSLGSFGTKLDEFAARLEGLPDGRSGDRIIDYYNQIQLGHHLSVQTELLTSMLAKLGTMTSITLSGSGLDPKKFMNGELTVWQSIKKIMGVGRDIAKIPFSAALSTIRLGGKGIHEMWKAGVDTAFATVGKAWRETKSFLGIGKIGPTNVYLRRDMVNPVLRKTAMQSGEAYFDKETLDPIRSWEDIKGPVVDQQMEELITAQDLDEGIYNSRFQLLNAKMLGLAKKGWDASWGLVGQLTKPLGLARELVTTTWNEMWRNQMTLDVYVKGDTKVRLLSKDLLRGRYFSAKTDKIITKYNQLYDGVYEIFQGKPRIVISEEEAQEQGLVDYEGKPLEGRFVRLLKAPFRAGMRMFRTARDTMVATWEFGKEAVGGLWSLLTGGVGGLANFFGIGKKVKDKGKGSLVETNEILTKIYNLLLGRFGDGSLDGITVAEQAKEKKENQEKEKEKKKEKPSNDPTSRVIKELEKVNRNLDDIEALNEEPLDEAEDESLLDMAEDALDLGGGKKKGRGPKKPGILSRLKGKLFGRGAAGAATAAEGAALRGGARVAAQGAATAVAGLSTAAIAGIVVAAGAVWVGYKYNFGDTVGPLIRLRHRSYGINPADYGEDWVDKICSLEDEMLKDVRSEGGRPVYRNSKSATEWAAMLVGLGIPNGDVSRVGGFFKWFNQRFMPSLLSFYKLSEKEGWTVGIQNIDNRLNEKEAYDFGTRFVASLPQAIFQVLYDPFNKQTLKYGYESLTKMLDEMAKAAGLNEQEQQAVQKKHGVDLIEKGLNVRRDTVRRESGQSPIKPPAPKKRTVSVGEASLSFTVNPDSNFYAAPLTKARFKGYGITQGTQDQIDVLAAMEAEVYHYMRVGGGAATQGNVALDGMSLGDIRDRFRAVLGWPEPKSTPAREKGRDAGQWYMAAVSGGGVGKAGPDSTDPFEEWLNNRFMPTLKLFAFFIHTNAKGSKIENAHTKMAAEHQLKVVQELQMLQQYGKPIWSYPFAPFPNVTAVSDGTALAPEIEALKKKVKADQNKANYEAAQKITPASLKTAGSDADSPYKGPDKMADLTKNLPKVAGGAAPSSGSAPMQNYVMASSGKAATDIAGQVWTGSSPDEDWWWLANNFYYEDRTSTTTDQDLAQIGHVVLNRVRFKHFGIINGKGRAARTIKDVITSKSQFSWYPKDYDPQYKKDTAQWERMQRVAKEFLAGKYPNNVGAADHYYAYWMDNPPHRPPAWAKDMKVDYGIHGKHRFMSFRGDKGYKEKYGGEVEGDSTKKKQEKPSPGEGGPVDGQQDKSLQSSSAAAADMMTKALGGSGGGAATPPPMLAASAVTDAGGAVTTPEVTPKVSLGGTNPQKTTPSLPNTPFETSANVDPKLTVQATAPTVKRETQQQESFSSEAASLIKQSNGLLSQIVTNTGKMAEMLTGKGGTPTKTQQQHKAPPSKPPLDLQ